MPRIELSTLSFLRVLFSPAARSGCGFLLDINFDQAAIRGSATCLDRPIWGYPPPPPSLTRFIGIITLAGISPQNLLAKELRY
jgi:hypothetical protein